ncbi:electron transfer flavoprotein subunit beta [Candidatus Geothermarchaeota archaeon ex4572_27]|nr:MAG: electron transfer flavoprotein subunit beta [Candidatus Geothermarchaeota archaeon ex4572_27]
MPLKIITCIKWVPNTMAVSIDEKTGTLIREGVPSIANPHDLCALEAALQLRDRYGGEVTVISMAPPSAVLGLEHALGMGADRAILISDRAFAGADTLATSYTLAKAIERIGEFDLIVTGQETIDSSTAHIGAQVASWLNIPYVYYVVDAEYDESRRVLRVKRMLENMYEVYEMDLPGLISIAMHAFRPRRVRLENKLRAKLERRVEVWTNEVLKLDERCVGLRGSATAVTKIEFMPKVPRKRQVFRGRDPKEAARWLVSRLIEDGLLKL